jgi:hypothetical protein
MAGVAAATCVGAIQCCAQRFAALTSTGAPLTGLHGYQTSILTEAVITPNIEAGNEDVVKNACGNICQVFEECDRLKDVDIDLKVCSLEPDLVNLLIGGRSFTSGGFTQGIEFPLPTDACNNGVSTELWQLAWNSNAQATTGGSLLYVHWIFPRVLYQLSAMTVGPKFTIFEFKGKAKVNASITANGPFDDWPTTSGLVAAGGMTGLGGFIYDTTTLPTKTCGLVNVPSSAS